MTTGSKPHDLVRRHRRLRAPCVVIGRSDTTTTIGYAGVGTLPEIERELRRVANADGLIPLGIEVLS